MSASPPREIGTLIAVILKARNLPNKRHIGKQDPYCTVEHNGHTRRTKAIKRGGQHPEWDEEVRFSLLEDPNAPAAHAGTDPDAPLPPPKKPGEDILGGKSMKIACYAEYMRDPEFIGETQVDLTEVLTKGETDEWFTLMNKGKYSGEVYLELTFWSNEPPPVKKASSKPKSKKQYGGPGTFVPSDAPGSAPSTPPGNGTPPPLDPYASISNGLYSMSSGSLSEAGSEAVPSSLRASSSIVRRELYTAPYETSHSQRSFHSVDSLTNDFAELGVQNDPARSAAYLPPSSSYTYPPPSNIQHSQYPSIAHSESQPYYEYERSGSYVEEPPQDVYDQSRPLTPGQSQGNGTLPPQPLYQAPYEVSGSTQSSRLTTGKPHGRYSLPTSSSGFVPIPSPAPSMFMAPHTTGYLPPQPTPGPASYPAQPAYSQLPPPVDPAASAPGPHGYGAGYASGYLPPRSPVPPSYVPSRSPVPPSNISPPPSTIAQSQSYPVIPPSTSYYQQYPAAAYPPNTRSYVSTATPPMHYAPEPQQHHLPTPPVQTPAASQGPPDLGGYAYQQQQAYPQVPPPPPLSTLSHSTSSPMHAHVSRPLPQPVPRARRHSMVTGTPSQMSMNGGYDAYSYAHIPPPPPLPNNAGSPGGAQVSYGPGVGQHASTISVPPPPPPPSTIPQPQPPAGPARHHSLNGYSGSHPLPPPPPPQHMQQQSTMQIPPPPPSVMQTQGYYQAPAQVDARSQHPGPLPRPPQIAPPTGPSHHSPIAAAEWQ